MIQYVMTHKLEIYIYIHVFVGVSNRPTKTQVAEQLLLVSQERLGQSFLEEHQSRAGTFLLFWKLWAPRYLNYDNQVILER